MKFAYRPDIDGMRAVSVIAVILFHFGVPGFAGGFVGVDVFFVISGYLITRQLQEYRDRPVAQALGEFYLRRARRILPASLVMLAVVGAGAMVLLMPFDLERFGRALVMTPAFLGNIAAWQSGNYFLAGDTPSPLLHMWSLAVEEQFYLAFPLLLLAATKRSAGLARGLVLSAALISFVLCAWSRVNHGAVAFYFSPMRAWELMLGALLALDFFADIRRPALRELCAAAGLAILIFAIVTGETTAWSHWRHALAPCIAAMLLIHSAASAPTRLSRVLSLRPIVFIGLISYSLYLWHMPVHVLGQYYFILPLTMGQQLALFVAIFALSVLSWRFVELPVRRRQVLTSARMLAGVAGAVSIALMLVGALLWKFEGVPQRFPAEVLRLADTSRRYHREANRCSQLPITAVAAGDLCLLNSPEGKARTMVLWGDSHALALLPAFESLARSREWRLYFAMHSACRPLFGISTTRVTPKSNADCDEFNSAMSQALRRLQPDSVVLAAYWDSRYGAFTIPGQPELTTPRARYRHALEETLRQIVVPGRRVCIVRGVPHYEYPVPVALARSHLRGMDMNLLRMPSDAARAQYSAMEPELDLLVKQRRVIAVDPKDRLCDGALCRLVNEEGSPLYADSNHLNIDGAMFVTGSLARCFDENP
jgi:peptidoglycan/LPS O-acetylase OafA/YrhL